MKCEYGDSCFKKKASLICDVYNKYYSDSSFNVVRIFCVPVIQVQAYPDDFSEIEYNLYGDGLIKIAEEKRILGNINESRLYVTEDTKEILDVRYRRCELQRYLFEFDLVY